MPVDSVEHTHGAGQRPISAHPAFPAVVALWFAALFGLGTLILPLQLLEQLVAATGIATVIPAAAPPLGLTARAAMALVATLFGAGFGFAAARRIGGLRKRPHRNDKGEPAEHRFLNAAEDIDDEGISVESPAATPESDAAAGAVEPVSAQSRRRPLTVAEEQGPSDYLPHIPLPQTKRGKDSGSPERDEVNEAVLELEIEIEPGTEPDDEATGVPEVCDDAAVPHQQFIVTEVVGEEARLTSEPLAFSPPSMGRQPEPSQDETSTEISRQEETNSQPCMPESALDADDATHSEANEQSEIHVSDKESKSTEPTATPEEGVAHANETGLVQLVQKLGSTIERHREWSARRTAEQASHSSQSGAAIPQDFDAAPADDAAQAMAAYFGKSTDASSRAAPPASSQQVNFRMPEGAEAKDKQPSEEAPSDSADGLSYAPFGEDLRMDVENDDDDSDEGEFEELTASLTLPLRTPERPAQPQAPPVPIPDRPRTSREVTDQIEGPQAQAQGDSPKTNNPFRRDAEEFVRIEEPEPDTAQPTVLFPNQQSNKSAAPEVTPAEDDQEAPTPAGGSRAFDPPAGQSEKRASRQSASNDDSERALREALMNLQRMGK